MIRRFAFLALCCLLTLPARAAPPANETRVLNVQEIPTKAAASLWLVEDHTVPVISVAFSFDGGLAYDPKDKPGVGRLVSILLDEGAGDLKSQDFQARLADNAISMSFTAGRDAFHGQLKTLSDKKTTAFALLALALSQPRFDADAVTRMKNANVSAIRDSLGDPEWLISRTFNGAVFEGDAYARPGYGTLASMERIGRGDLRAFVRAAFTQGALRVAIAGDITRAEAERAVEQIFGPLPAQEAPAEDKDPAPFRHAGKTVLLPFDSPQTFVAAAAPGVAVTDPDWPAAQVMNQILGGGSFDARLMKSLREERGLTYGAYSVLSSMKRAALLQANLSVGREKTSEALTVLKREWARFAKDGPTGQEVRDAKDYLTGSLVLGLTSTGDVAGVLNGLQQDGLDADYINRRNKMIEAVQAEDVRRVAARLLDPAKLAVVMVGQPQGIKVDVLLDRPPGMEDSKKDDK